MNFHLPPAGCGFNAVENFEWAIRPGQSPGNFHEA